MSEPTESVWEKLMADLEFVAETDMVALEQLEMSERGGAALRATQLTIVRSVD